MRTTWSFHSPGQVTFGPGASRQTGEILLRRKVRRALLVTDQNLVHAGLVEIVRQSLEAAGIVLDVFQDGEAEPSIETAVKAIEHARSFRPDGVVGLGGGSNMDLSKITAALYTHGGLPSDYFGFDKIPGPIIPLVCIPTTAGTGSEVSHSAVLTDTANAMKVSTLSQHLRPLAAVVDPELTYQCPRHVTADAGIDALTHAIEAFSATDFGELRVPPGEKSAYEGRFPLSDCLAEKAIELVGRYLVAVVQDGENRAARDGMALAATLAGLAFSNAGVALVHALEYPIGGALHCSHGAGNGMLLPYVMRFNLPVRQSTFARVAALLGENVCRDDEAQAAEKAIAAVERIKRQIGIPTRIRDLGGTAEQLAAFAAKAHAIQRLRWVNPRDASEEELLAILQAAF